MKFWNRKKTATALAVLITAFFIGGPTFIYASASYTNWTEYAAGNGVSAKTWNAVADAMDEVLDAAVSSYGNGDTETALSLISTAKNGFWGDSGFKIAMQKNLPSASKKGTESAFTACNSTIKNGRDASELSDEVEELKSIYRSAANKLDGVEEEIEIAEEGESDATAIFAQQYCATWDEYSTAAGLTSWTWNNVADAMTEVFKTAKEKYAAGDAEGAYACINDGYYGYYETTGFERNAMGYISGARKSEVELQFSACKSATKGGTVDEFNQQVDILRTMIRTDANKLDGVSEDGSEDGTTRSAAAATFIACFTIILREGFEAILVVGAIIAYLMKANADDPEKKKKQTHPVYWGAIIGILASFVSAWLLNQLKLANSASQEIIEGVTALIAVVVLYWVSNWMVSKSESEAWSAYIKSKVKSSSDKGSVGALAFTSFLAVYREGAEVILFYQPLLSGDNMNMVWTGFLVGCVCLVFVYLAIRLVSFRLPLKPFFLATSILMFVMSIAFLGSGIKELIEGDVIPMTASPLVAWIPSNSFLEILGIYPCDQTVFPQLILLAVTIVVFIMQLRRNKRLRLAAEAAEKEEAVAA